MAKAGRWSSDVARVRFPPKYPMRNMREGENRGLRERELVEYYEKVLGAEGVGASEEALGCLFGGAAGGAAGGGVVEKLLRAHSNA
jgi:hypothetical protein